MKVPARTSIEETYGDAETRSAIKMITLAPELEGSEDRIKTLSEQDGIVVSIGHSGADFDTGLTALKAGARALTHVFNAMNPLHHRLPGLAGLIASPEAPYFSLIADGIHLHPATLTMAFRSNPQRCILITDVRILKQISAPFIQSSGCCKTCPDCRSRWNTSSTA